MTVELEWVAAVLGEPVAAISDLQDGTLLCKTVNTIKPDTCRYKPSRMAFVMRENIVAFLHGAAALGVTDDELFDVEDLYDFQNDKQVMTCIRALSRVAPTHNAAIVPIGPSLAQKHKPPKPKMPKYAGWGAQYGHRDGKSDYS